MFIYKFSEAKKSSFGILLVSFIPLLIYRKSKISTLGEFSIIIDIKSLENPYQNTHVTYNVD